MRNQASALSNENWLLRKFSSCEQIFTEDVPWDGRWQLKKKTNYKTYKNCHFWRYVKKNKNPKNCYKIGWNRKKEVLGSFLNDFLATMGHTWGAFAPLKKIITIHARNLRIYLKFT